MNHHYWIRGTVLVSAFGLVIQSGCEYKAPASPWEESLKQNKILPTITRIEPAEAGSASEITLIGKDFSPVDSLNAVYFNDVPAVIKSSSDTHIVVLRPNVIGNSITISVVVNGAVGIAKFPGYGLGAVVEEFGHFAGIDKLFAFAVDAEENTYLAMSGNSIIRLNPDGGRDLNYLGVGTTAVNTSLMTDMKVGPDGMIYMARSNNLIVRLPADADSDAVETVVTLADRADRIKCIDFDPSGILYAGGKNSDLIVIRSAADIIKAGVYKEYEINSIHVSGGFVYLAAVYTGKSSEAIKSGVWRHAVQADGSVGIQELVLNWSAGPFSGATVNTIELSESGKVYIGSNDAQNPVVMVDPDSGEYRTLFYGIIPSPVDRLAWGNSTHLYAVIHRTSQFEDGCQLLKINTGERAAP